MANRNRVEKRAEFSLLGSFRCDGKAQHAGVYAMSAINRQTQTVPRFVRKSVQLLPSFVFCVSVVIDSSGIR